MHLAQTFQTQRESKKASARHFDRSSIARVPVRQLTFGEGEVQSPTYDGVGDPVGHERGHDSSDDHPKER